ncbi:MAG: hypothetical protein NTY15_06925 [Planctomycetota bacterium]|nr:hypothetical protein [Planctomycetota bacterium]
MTMDFYVVWVSASESAGVATATVYDSERRAWYGRKTRLWRTSETPSKHAIPDRFVSGGAFSQSYCNGLWISRIDREFLFFSIAKR